jgi:hypothetical protein
MFWLTILIRITGLGNSVQHFLGYDYTIVQGCPLFRTPVLSCWHHGSKVHMLRVQDQAKQVAHFGPTLSTSCSKRRPFSSTKP